MGLGLSLLDFLHTATNKIEQIKTKTEIMI